MIREQITSKADPAPSRGSRTVAPSAVSPLLRFHIENVEAGRASLLPMLLFRLRIHQQDAEPLPVPIRGIWLQSQIRIVSKEDAPQSRMAGDSAPRTRGTLLWAHSSVYVPPFETSTTVDLPVPCSFDFNLATTRHLEANRSGTVKLLALFSGSVSFRTREGRAEIAQIPWDADARFEMPVQVWRGLMQRFYGDQVFIEVDRPVLAALGEYQQQAGLDSLGEAIEDLLEHAG